MVLLLRSNILLSSLSCDHIFYCRAREADITGKVSRELKFMRHCRGYERRITLGHDASCRLQLVNDVVELFRFGPIKPKFSDYAHNSTDYVPGWAPNVYAQCFKESFMEYCKAMENIVPFIMELVSMAMGQLKFFLSIRSNRAPNLVSAAYYPVVSTEKRPNLGLCMDSSLFTVMWQNNTKDILKIKTNNDQWITLNSPQPDALIIVAGECTKILANGHWMTTHSIPQSNGVTRFEPRLSLSHFVQMNPDTLIKCLPKYLNSSGRNQYVRADYKFLVQNKMKDAY